MGKIANQSFQTTLYSYIGVVIGYINVLWLYPYALEAAQLGTFRTIQDMALLLVPFAQMGLGLGITRFFPQLEKGHSAFLNFSLLISLLGFLVVASGAWIFKDEISSLFASNSPELIQYLWIVLFITFLALANTILDAYSRSFVKVAVPTFFREVLLRLLTGIWISCFLLGWITFDQLMPGLIGIYAIPLIGMILYLSQKKVLSSDFSWQNFPKGFRSSFISFSLISFLATAASTLILKIDSIMVSSLISLEANAIYSIAFSMATVIEMPKRAISQVIMPVVSKLFSENRLNEIQDIYKQLAKRQLYLSLLIFTGIWINIDAIYLLIPNQSIYQAGKWVVFWIGLGKIIDAAFSANSEILVFSKYYRFNLIATLVMSIAIILLNYLFIPRYGIEGAAFASAFVFFTFNLVKYGYLKRTLQLDPFDWEQVGILAMGLGIGFILMLIPDFSHALIDLVVKSMLLLVLYGISAKLGLSGKEELNWVLEKIKKPGS